MSVQIAINPNQIKNQENELSNLYTENINYNLNKIIIMKRKSAKLCKLSYCGKPLFLSDNPVNGCCCEAHWKQWKREYNANYYQQRTEVFLNEKYSSMLRSCLRQFGEDFSFDSEILEQMGFDWEFSKKTVVIDDNFYQVIGEYGYIVYFNEKINIKRL